MRTRFIALLAMCGTALGVAPAAHAFTVVQPQTGECRQVLIPGPTTFPGNWEAVSSTPAAAPGPWNGHTHANDNSALGPVLCP